MNIKDSYVHNGVSVLKDIKIENSVLKKILAGVDANGNYLDWTTVLDLTTIKPTAAGTADVAKCLTLELSRGGASPNNNSGAWATVKNGSTNPLSNKVQFWTIYDDGGPSTYGDMLEILSKSSKHWLPQLWFGSGAGGHMYYRNKDYNSDVWGPWLTLLDSTNYSLYALPKSGGTMTGALTVPSLTVTGASTFSQAINGSILGNAATASRLLNVRNIAISGAVTGNANFDGSGNITISTSVNHNHDDLYSKRSTYTLPSSKGVRISYSAYTPVLISVSGSNSGAQLIIIGTGYGEGGRTRNLFTELVSCSLFDWCIPNSESISCSVEIYSRRNSDSTVKVISTEAVTFTLINELTSAKENATLITSSNYTSYVNTTNFPGLNSVNVTSHLYVGGSSATSNATSAVSDPYLCLVEGSTHDSHVQLKASTGISISANNGIVTITNTSTNSHTYTSTWTALTANANLPIAISPNATPATSGNGFKANFTYNPSTNTLNVPNIIASGSTSIDDATIGNLVVNGGASFALTINGNITSADKVNHSLTILLNSGTTEGTNKFTFNGSAAKSINITPSAIGAKATQSAVSDPTASGTGISYIATISLNAQGVITATKSTVRSASTSLSGVVTTGELSFAGAKTFTGKTTISTNNFGNQFVLNRGNDGGTWGPSIIFQNNGSFGAALGCDINGVVYIGDNGSTNYKIYHAGNLSIGTLMGSTAIGDSDEPVYWSGSAFVKAGAYPTKASWNYDDIYLPLTSANYNTNTDANPFIISRTGLTSEALAISLNDSRTLFKYTNDEASNSIVFQLVNTDTERAENKGLDASDRNVTISSGKSGISMTIDGNTVWHAGNLTTSAALDGGTTKSLVTTGDKYKWNLVYDWLTTTTADTDTTINKWKELETFLTSITESDTLSGLLADRVAKSGDTMTGNLTIGSTSDNKELTVNGTASVKTLTISSTDGTDHIKFSRTSYNYITTPSGGCIVFEPNGAAVGAANGMTIDSSGFRPSTTKGYSLGTSSLYWNNIYGTSIYLNGTALSSASTHAHGDYVTSISWDSTNNKLSWSKGGSALTAITIGYATNSGSLGGVSNSDWGLWKSYSPTSESTLNLKLNFRKFGVIAVTYNHRDNVTELGGFSFDARNVVLHILGSSSTYWHQLGFSTGHLKIRYDASSSFLTILDSSNYSSYAVPLSGGTMTGALTTPSLTVTGASSFSLAINGSILGNAATASRLLNARTIKLTGNITSSAVSFDGSGNIEISTNNTGVRAATISGNYLRINTNGTNADLTIPYASSAGNADTVDSRHADSFYNENYNESWKQWHVGNTSNDKGNKWYRIARFENTNPGQYVASKIHGYLYRHRGNHANGQTRKIPFMAVVHFTNDIANFYYSTLGDTDHLRLVKLATRTYELQVKEGSNEAFSIIYQVVRGNNGVTTYDACDSLGTEIDSDDAIVTPEQIESYGNYAYKADKLATKRSLTIGNESHDFDGSAAVTWSLASIGAAATSHNHNASDINAGTLGVARGGTGKSSWTQYGIVYASATDTLSLISLPTWAASTTYWLKCVTNGSKVPTYSLSTISKSDVGLGNVDNTADVDKNVNSSKYLSVTSSITSESSITESGVRAYSGIGSTWAGSIASMAYAAILTLGNPNRGWQMWARRANSDGMYWRRGNSEGAAWEDPRLFLDSVNYTSYTVTKEGTGASGTWEISITGNATTATTASTSNALDWNKLTSSSITKSISSGSWTATGVSTPTTYGTYVVQVLSGDYYYSGIFSAGTTDDSTVEEIPLHSSAPSQTRLYLATKNKLFLISSGHSSATSVTFTITYQRLL